MSYTITTMDFPEDIENPKVESHGKYKDYHEAVAAAQGLKAFYTSVDSTVEVWNNTSGATINLDLARRVHWLDPWQQQQVIDLVNQLASPAYPKLPAVI
jgi:hypothetical protein